MLCVRRYNADITCFNFDLVKRCLYLFAAQTKDNGQVSACLFTEPKFIVDDTFLLDYSMFFGATLLDYYEALLICGRKEQALEYMKYYWGGMLKHGADTFWELYNPENPAESPYGSSIVNSYCHAWSCTPAYLLRKYF